jgi:hypothetical protein
MRAFGLAYGGSIAQPGAQNRSQILAKKQSDLHLRCVQLGRHAETDITALVPHRTWTWRLDFEKSRKQLGQVRRDLIALGKSEAEFEASLDSGQKSRVQSSLNALKALLRHLESDAQSLDSELREGYPTRWHVARDSFDMQKEIRLWNRLHDKVAAKLNL